MSEIILKIDPITRIEGHLGMYAKVDVSTRKVVDAYTIAIMFRGFEIILKGRRPDSAIFITSRSCGVCGAAHANASVQACDMALGVPPTPLGVCLRNLAYAMTDYAYDHSVLLSLLEGPDYSELVVSKLTPSVYRTAQGVACEHAGFHGYKTIADMMSGWNPIPKPGKTYLLTVYYQRLAKEAGALIYGKYGHPATLCPGGIIYSVTDLDKIFEYYLKRLVMLTMWVKWIVAQWQDMLEFYKTYVEVSETGKAYAEVEGLTYDPPIMLSAGLFDDPMSDIYKDARPSMSYEEVYDGINKAYSERLFRPGFVCGGTRIDNAFYAETEFAKIQTKMVELMTTSYYHNDPSLMGKYTEEDPLGNPLASGVAELIPYHEWNKQTIPRPGKLPPIPEELPETEKRYSWCTEPRMVFTKGGKTYIVPFEAGPIAKLWCEAAYTTTKTLKLFPGVKYTLQSGNGEITINLPKYDDVIELAQDIVDEAYKLGLLKRHYKVRDELPSELYGLSRSEVPDLYDNVLTVKWVNERSTTLYRLYARAVSLVCAIIGAWWTLKKLLEVYREKLNWYNVPGRPWKYPSYPTFALGVGWLEAPRGAVRHWIVVQNGVIANYQYHAPTTGNATPRTDLGFLEKLGAKLEVPASIKYIEKDGYLVGPYEAAGMNCYITEEVEPTQWTGLDIVRAIRSFDPCIGCAVHADISNVKKIIRKISPFYWSP